MVQPDSSFDRLTKDTKVSDAVAGVGGNPVIVRLETTLRELASTAAQRLDIRILCVVDDDERLQGVIRITALCDDLFFHVAPEEFIADILGHGKIDEFRRFRSARVAKDLMEPVEPVTGDDILATAFRRLHERNLDGLPIVDVAGRPVGYLDRLRLITVWLQMHPESGPA